MKEPIGVLFVCLGNICRSPAAEGVFLHLLQKASLKDRFVVDSCGTGRWHIGKPADSRMIAASARRSIDLPSICRQLDVSDFTAFHYIIPMDSDNLRNISALAPNHSKAKILPMWTYVKSTTLEGIPDPFYGDEQGFESVLDYLEEGCRNLLHDICVREEISCEK